MKTTENGGSRSCWCRGTLFDPKEPGFVVIRLPGRDMEVFISTLDNADKRLGWRYPKGKEPKNAPPKGDFPW